MNVIIPSSLFVRNMLFDPFHGYTGHFQTFDPSDKIVFAEPILHFV